MRNFAEPDFHALVDAENGTVDRAVFSDADIYELEMERIFARAWNFMCHESQIPKPGDFFLNYIGEECVIATRNKNGELRVLLNTCRHRGNAVCRAEMGNAKSFMCTYHGWTYDLDGKLIGVPGLRDFYHHDLDREKWGLIAAARVESYKGFVFATMDADAPPLEAYLGPVGQLGLSLAAERGDMVMVDGVQKYVIGCNWKLAVDNLFDWYHPQVSHASAEMAGFIRPRAFSQKDHIVALGEYGHAIGGPRMTGRAREIIAREQGEQDMPQIDESWRGRPEAEQALGPIGIQVRGHPNIFPNLWVATSGTQLSLRLPRGPNKTEIWWFTMVDSALSPERRNAIVRRTNHTFGPAGLLEQDDGENWDQSTRATRGVIARKYPLNFAMNCGRGEILRDQSGLARIETHINEHAQLWTYRAWADWMAAKDWAALRRRHAMPSGVV